jgi:hypothetical protein
MPGHRPFVKLASAAVALTVVFGVSWAADKDKTVAGIVIDKGDKWIKVKTDGEEDAVKYVYDPADKKLAAALKGIFTVSRVQVVYEPGDGDARLVRITKAKTKTTGTVTGEVLAVHDNFWIEVKPKDGPPDGYALNYPPEKYKAVAETLKGLKKGDTITLRFTTDFERHRIETLKKEEKK